MVTAGAEAFEAGSPGVAEQWFQRSADTGNAEGMFQMGLLVRSRGDDVTALTWYRRAVDAGHVNALNNIAVVLKGQGRQSEALQMYGQGAARGDGVAMINLGQMLEDDGDSHAALEWNRKARDAGEDRARERVERLELVLRRPESDWSGGGSGRSKYCSDCGSKLVGVGRFCPNCGAATGWNA